jgi:CheY-like chemotaxis protein
MQRILRTFTNVVRAVCGPEAPPQDEAAGPAWLGCAEPTTDAQKPAAPGDSREPCPRCGDAKVRNLGNARSTLSWYACSTCQHVWVDRKPPAVTAPTVKREPGAARILAVDDDSSVLQFLQRALAEYNIVTARDGSEAMMLASSELPDLLITDYVMPDTTGIELVAWIRERNPTQKVIVLTGYGDLLHEEPWWENERYIAKPCKMSDLRRTVEELLNAPSGARNR